MLKMILVCLLRCFVFYVFVTYLVQTLPTLSVAPHLSQMLKLRYFIHLISFFFLIFKSMYLFTWLCQVLQHMGSSAFGAACGIFSCGMQTLPEACRIQFSDQGSNQHPLTWKHGVFVTRPPGK